MFFKSLLQSPALQGKSKESLVKVEIGDCRVFCERVCDEQGS